MKVSEKEFNRLYDDCSHDIRHRRIERRLQLLGLGLQLAFNSDTTDEEALRTALTEQAERHSMRQGIGGYILSQIIAMIVGKIIEWLIDSQKKTRLVCASEEDQYELPELR